MSLMEDQYYFYKMIVTLRSEEEVVLYNNILQSNTEEDKKVINFLKQEYINESTDYPYQAPDFDEEAAIWAARTIYLTAQLLLYRENRPAELQVLFPTLNKPYNESAILSVDLCLRFLPDMVRELKFINPDDELIAIVEQLLIDWPFSAVNTDLEFKQEKLESVVSSSCTKQLFINRIIDLKNKKIAENAFIKKLIVFNLGMYEKEIWPELNLN